MDEFLWLSQLPSGTLDGGIGLANRLFWNITWAGNDQRWCVWAGEDLLLRTEHKSVAEAFLYGLGLAYAVLPEGLFGVLEAYMRREVGEDVAAPPEESEG